MRHPWPAVIAALLGTNLVTAAAVVLWSQERLAEQAGWAANRQKTADLVALVTDLGGLAEWLEVAANGTLPARVRGDAVGNATGPANSLEDDARTLAEDYAHQDVSLADLWSGLEALGLSRRAFPAIVQDFYSAGATSSYHRGAIENITRIARGAQGLLYPAARTFDPSAVLSAFATDPLAALAAAERAALGGLASQATCLYDRLYLGEDFVACVAAVRAP